MALEQVLSQQAHIPHRGKYRDWGHMSDEQVLGAVRAEHGDIHSWKLSRVDQYAYDVLRKRGLTPFLRNNIYWDEMSNDDVLTFIFDNYGGNMTPRRLKRIDPSAYETMHDRGLLDRLNKIGVH